MLRQLIGVINAAYYLIHTIISALITVLNFENIV